MNRQPSALQCSLVISKRDRAASLLYRTGLTSLPLRLGPRRRTLRLLVYHRVRELTASFRFDPELVSASCEQFSWQMRFVKDHCTPISFRELARILDGDLELPRNPIIVTFDDGYDDNYLHAYPILRSLGVKATVFVATDYVGSGLAFWFDRVAHILSVAPAGRSCMAAPSRVHPGFVVPAGIAERRVLVKMIQSRLKSVSNDDLLEFVDALSREFDVPAPLDHPDSRLLSWEQLAEMQSSGFVEVGSHSRSHAVLSQLSRSKLVDELEGSRDAIQRAFGVDCPVIAYPVGGRNSYNEDVIRAVRECGYRFACTNMGGVNRLSSLSPYELRRSAVERYTTPERFYASLAFPACF